MKTKTITADEREARAAVKIARAIKGAGTGYACDRWKRALLHGMAMSGKLGFAQLRQTREILTLP